MIDLLVLWIIIHILILVISKFSDEYTEYQKSIRATVVIITYGIIFNFVYSIFFYV